MKVISLVFVLVIVLPVKGFASDCVILLHGLARTDSSMAKMEEALEREGYKAINAGYPSRKYEIEKLAGDTISAALKECGGDKKVNFVTHSMGGILVRQYLSEYEISNLNHVVMLGPPNQGSEVIDSLGTVPGFKLINGPAGLQLGTGEMSVPNKLGAADFSLGVIAGAKTINLILSSILPKPNDGKVSVESTMLNGMDDHIAMPVTHPFMMKNKKVIQQVIYFLKNGKFNADTI
ncbi:MAG: alpha/beta hydrolase [Agarilytica sp.]